MVLGEVVVLRQPSTSSELRREFVDVHVVLLLSASIRPVAASRWHNEW